MIALIGTTIDRNTTISSRNDSPSTNASTIHWYVSVRSRKSRKNAVFPPTATPTPDTPSKARHDVLTQVADRVERRVVLRVPRRTPTRGSRCRPPRARPGSAARRPASVPRTLELRDRRLHLRRVDVARHDDLGRLGQAAGELALQGQERGFRGHVVRERLDARRAPLVELEHEDPERCQDASEASRNTTGRRITPLVSRSQNPPRGSGRRSRHPGEPAARSPRSCAARSS